MSRGPLGLPKLEGQERRTALEDPGPSWKEWFYHSALKAYVALGFLIGDAWLATAFFSPFDPAALGASLLAAVYLEFLAYRYLWYRPDPDVERLHGRFQRTWLRPTQFGRWTPEGERLRAGLTPFPDAGPDPRDFL